MRRLFLWTLLFYFSCLHLTFKPFRVLLITWTGVTSFNIDFAAKKVTVVGDVTPLSVLASISKVKNAQFWPEHASVIGSATPETKRTNFI